jgi:hypothetical protein
MFGRSTRAPKVQDSFAKQVMRIAKEVGIPTAVPITFVRRRSDANRRAERKYDRLFPGNDADAKHKRDYFRKIASEGSLRLVTK